MPVYDSRAKLKAVRATRKKNIGIMGGTFDPIHLGHLITAEAVREQIPLDEVIFIPAALPPHKLERRVVPAAKRLFMTKLAIEGHPSFVLSDMELKRKGPSYSSDTLRALRRDYGEGADFYFITGADAASELYTWHDAAYILTVCQVVATTRQGATLDRETLARYFAPELLQRILPLETPAIGISSTDIRQRLKLGKSIRYLVPEAVADYIYKEGLYS